MIDVIADLAWALIGASVVIAVQLFAALRRATKRAPSKEEIEDLRQALYVWATKYKQAKPTGRYAKRREAELFEACTKVGIMWISPSPPRSTGEG